MKKKLYETPAMNVYDMQPTCLLAGSNSPGSGGDGDHQHLPSFRRWHNGIKNTPF